MRGAAQAELYPCVAAPLHARLGRAGVPGKKAHFFLVDAEHKAFRDGEDRQFSCRRGITRHPGFVENSGATILRFNVPRWMDLLETKSSLSGWMDGVSVPCFRQKTAVLPSQRLRPMLPEKGRRQL